MPMNMDERYQDALFNAEWERAKQNFHADPATAPGTPTPEDEALKAPGEYGKDTSLGTSLATSLVDPGVLLDPTNIGAGAGIGAKVAQAGEKIKGALTGAAQAAGGLYTIAGQFGKGLLKGFTGRAEQPSISTPEPATLNIGLNVGDKTALDEAQVQAAIEHAGGKVKSITTHQSGTEPTAVVELHNPLTPEQAHMISEGLNQDAIAQMTGKTGELYGPKADAWKPFNPSYFLKPNGKPASEEAVATSAQKLKDSMLSKLSIQRVGTVGEHVVSTRPRLKAQEELAGRQLAGTDPPLQMLRDINPNTPLSDTDLLAFKEVVDPELTKLIDFARKGNAGEFTKQWDTVVNYAPSFLGVETAGARATAMANEPVKPVASTGRAIAETAFDPNIQDVPTLMAHIAELKTTDEAASVLYQAQKPTMNGLFKYLYVNGILSPASNFINMVATSGNVAFSIPERALMELSSAATKTTGKILAATGEKIPNEPLSNWMIKTGEKYALPGTAPGESALLSAGYLSSFGDAFRLAFRAFKQDAPIFGENRVEAAHANRPNIPALFGKNTLEEVGVFGRALDYLAQGAGLTGRFMMTGDEFLKTFAANGEAAASVYRTAYNQLSRGEISASEFGKATREAATTKYWNVDPAVARNAEQFAIYTTLNKELGKFGKAFMGMREAADNLTPFPIGTTLQPFIRTLANSVKYESERTPLALLSKNVWSDIRSTDAIKRDAALGKIAFGAIFGAWATDMASNGWIQGRLSTDPQVAEAQREKGIQEDTFGPPGGNKISFHRIQPWGNMLGAYADIGRVWHLMNTDQQAEAASVLLQGTLAFFDTSFIRGSAGMATFFSSKGTKEDVRDLENFATRLPGGLVPFGSLIKTGENINDPYAHRIKLGLPLTDDQRERGAVEEAWGKTPATWQFQTAVEKILAGVPGYNTLAKKYGLPEVYAQRNIYGKKVELPKSLLGTEWFNPMYISKEKDDPFLEKLIQLRTGVQLPPAIMTNGTGIKKIRVPLTALEYDRFQEDVGKLIEERNGKWLDMIKDYQDAPLLQRELLTKFIHNTWKEAQGRALANPDRYPDLLRAYNTAAQTKGKELNPSNISVQPQ